MVEQIKKNDTLNCIGSGLLDVEKVTEKALLLIIDIDSTTLKPVMRWCPKSVINIIEIDKHLTSEIGNIYRCHDIPYFIRKNW